MIRESKTDAAQENGFEHGQRYAEQFDDLNAQHERVCGDGFGL